MFKKEIEKISYNVIIPNSLKTDNFDIITFLKLLNNNENEEKQLSLNDYSKLTTFLYIIKLKNENDLLNCISFFKSFSKRTSNLIRFQNWDDEKNFDFETDYKTIFSFVIPNLKRFCKKYNINFHPKTINESIKFLFKNEFLNV